MLPHNTVAPFTVGAAAVPPILILAPSRLSSAVASDDGAAGSLAGAEAWLPVAGACELLHAPTTAVSAAMAPTAASRWIFLNSISTPHSQKPGLSRRHG